MKRSIFLSIVLIVFGCSKTQNPIEVALKSKSDKILRVSKNIKKHELQTILTVIDSNKIFKDYTYNLNTEKYFYPASTVKLPVAVFAIEKLNENSLINLDTPYKIGGESITHTVRNDINEIMVMSSNEAYNRLFEFLGQDYINQKLNEKGMVKSKIFHRLEVENANDLKTRKLTFNINDSVNIYFKENNNTMIKPLRLKKLKKGIAYINANGDYIESAMNFSNKNYLPLKELHYLSKLLYITDSGKNNETLNLTNNQISFLKNSMNQTPNNIGYDLKKYPDTYSNFLVFGDLKNPINGISIYNKIGFAYGYVTETAIIETNKKSIIISISLKVNENEIFNDDEYEYENIAFPFLAEFGREMIRIVNAK